jgi:hypothetical protein
VLRTEPIITNTTDQEKEDVKTAWKIVWQYENFEQAFIDHPFFLMKRNNNKMVKEYFKMKHLYRLDESPINRIVHWYWGPSNCGKSTFVEFQLKKKKEKFGRNCCFYYSLSNNSAFFEGYNEQPYCCIDDIRNQTMSIQLLLNITNFLEMLVSIKGGSLFWKVKEIWFTSLFSIEECFCYSRDDGNVDQFIKRIAINIGFTKNLSELNDQEKTILTKNRYGDMIRAWKNVKDKDNFDQRKINLNDF